MIKEPSSSPIIVIVHLHHHLHVLDIENTCEKYMQYLSSSSPIQYNRRMIVIMIYVNHHHLCNNDESTNNRIEYNNVQKYPQVEEVIMNIKPSSSPIHNSKTIK